jgi:hypothetical protein
MPSLILLCARCGEAFEALSPGSRYCSVKCRLRARHERAIARLEAQRDDDE